MDNRGRSILSAMILLFALIFTSELALAAGGAPSGRYYTLNILGKAWDDKGLIDCDKQSQKGYHIFVSLDPALINPKTDKSIDESSLTNITQIFLTQSPDDSFRVLDCDGTGEANPAAFMLPEPNDPGSDCTRYSVWVRALGSPGGSAQTNTCVTSSDDEGFVWNECSREILDLPRTSGKGYKQKFDDVSKKLLTICVPVCVKPNETDPNMCDETAWKRKYLFDDSLENQYWMYNDGLRLAQIRFYFEPGCPDAKDDLSCK